MTTPRRILGDIDPNITSRSELSPYLRGVIAGRAQEGGKPTLIAKDLKVPKSTVFTTIRRDPIRNDGRSRPRSGRPHKYTERFKRSVIREVRQIPKISYAGIRAALQSEISDTTIRVILDEVGITHWRAKKRPFLTQEVAKKRYDWCIARKDWTINDFRNIIWSDECSAERGAGKSQEWVFCQPAQKWQKEMVSTHKKGKDICLMVWAAIWWKYGKVHKSDLVILGRDWESKKMGYTANSYLDVLDDQLPRIYEPGLIFMQDNAPIHTAKKVKDWFEEAAIPLLDWAPFSMDLNPIEHIWWHLKAKVLELFPELVDMGSGAGAIEALERALIEAWDSIDDTIIESCLESMCRRRDAVIAAKGWHTKY